MRKPRVKAAAVPPPPQPSVATPVAERGELSVRLEDVDYVLRPSFGAIGAIETATGRSTFQLWGDALTQAMPLAHAAIVVTECCNAAGQKFAAKRIAELIYGADGGLNVVIRGVVAPLLELAVTGRYLPSGELKPKTT